jgi:hypothetical protein
MLRLQLNRCALGKARQGQTARQLTNSAARVPGKTSRTVTLNDHSHHDTAQTDMLRHTLQCTKLRASQQQLCSPELAEVHQPAVAAAAHVLGRVDAALVAVVLLATAAQASAARSRAFTCCPGHYKLVQSAALCSLQVRSSTHHHNHVTQSSHSINAIGPAPLWSGRKREHCSIMFATVTHIPSLHKILSNTPRNHPAPPPTTPNIIRHKTQQLGRSIRQ